MSRRPKQHRCYVCDAAETSGAGLLCPDCEDRYCEPDAPEPAPNMDNWDLELTPPMGTDTGPPCSCDFRGTYCPVHPPADTGCTCPITITPGQVHWFGCPIAGVGP